MEIKKGSQITVRHNPSGNTIHYWVVEERETGLLRLLNLNSFYLMNGFKAKHPNEIVKYIEDIKCEIIRVSM